MQMSIRICTHAGPGACACVEEYKRSGEASLRRACMKGVHVDHPYLQNGTVVAV